MRGILVGADSWLYPSNLEKYEGMKELHCSILITVLTRKATKRVFTIIRTANRHRCSGREDQGVRVILRQGTRQTSGRNFGIRPAPSLYSTHREIASFLWKTRENLSICSLTSTNRLRANREYQESWTQLLILSVVDMVRGPQLRNPCNCLPKT